ncbi:MAG: hypothetical protein KJ065_09195 [Anaerolineae bacterium]|nr:hypothetical protein [Anaerolineae bacterium]
MNRWTIDPQGLPKRQKEFLWALASANQKPVKNAATRKALEDLGLIQVIDRKAWEIRLTAIGSLVVWVMRLEKYVEDVNQIPGIQASMGKINVTVEEIDDFSNSDVDDFVTN